MYKSILSLSILSILAVSCKKEQDPFAIEKQHVGLLTDSTKVKDLKMIFAQDSVATPITGDEYMSGGSDIEIFSKTGDKLLVLTPTQALDSTATIESVQIMDPRYKTAKNISTISTFKEIQDSYKITRINNLINTVVVFVDEINASFTIDKKELPANLRFDMNLKIEKSQIPDSAKVKYFFVHWN